MFTNSSKRCTKCNLIKSADNFGFHKQKNTLNSWCKSCNSVTSLAYKRTPRGLAQQTYTNQIRSSKRRKHPKPAYSKEWLTIWLITQPTFSLLFANWIKDGYSKKAIPSVDRVEDNLPYTENNIRLCTWEENNKKGNTRYITGDSPKATRKVDQLNLSGKFIRQFPSIVTASEAVNCSGGEITRVCKKQRNTCRNFKWRYSNNDTLHK